MIKATDLIKKEKIKRDFYYFKSKNGFKLGNNRDSLKGACEVIARDLYNEKYRESINAANATAVLEKVLDEREDKIAKLAARFEREFLRANKKSKFIILHGCTELVNMDIYMLPIDIVPPEKPEDIIYGNAVFDSREEAEEIAIAQCFDNYIIVEVSDGR